ncbi:hypothetical protein DJ68_17320 [Halorubrum sp. C3]|nr:hypothetical protein DJ68_17320 [Halorubrum sp. C3]
MTEFETQNTVDVVIDDRSLTEAKADVEDALSSVPLDVQAEVSGAGSGSEVAARDRARQRQLLTDQTSSIEELSETFEETDIEAEWQEEHELSRERNRLLEQLVDAQEEGNFDRAARAGGGLLGGGAAILGGGALLGIGALSSVLSSFSWPSLPEFSWPELPDLSPPPEPDWHPLDVVEPDPVEVGEPKEQPVEDPKEQPVADPKEQPVEDPKEQPVEDPEPVETPQPDWVPIEIGTPELSTDGVADGIGSSIGLPEILLGGAASAFGIEAIRSIGASTGGSAASGGAFLTPEGLGLTDPEGMNRRRQAINQRTPDWANLPEIPEDKYSGSVFSAEGRQAQAEGFQNAASRIEEAINSFLDDGGGNDDNSQQRTDIRVESNVTVEGATKREVKRAMEKSKEDALREFNRKISGRVR